MPTKSQILIGVLAAFVLTCPIFAQESTDDTARKIIEQFERALDNKNLKAVEVLVTPDIVVLENGHRNSGWVDFRDNHLVPEMKEPAPPRKSELIRAKSYSEMGWGYTKTVMAVTRKTGEKVTMLLWSTYFLEKREGIWKIAFLDWSIRPVKAGEKDSDVGPRVEKTGSSSYWSLEELKKRFKEAGLKTRQDVVIQQPFLSVAGVVLVIGQDEAEVQTYIYNDEESRKRDTEKLDPEKVVPPTMQVNWLMPAKLITDKNLAIIVLTRNVGLLAAIKAVIESKR